MSAPEKKAENSSRVSLSTMIAFLKNPAVSIGMEFDFDAKVIRRADTGEEVGDFNRLKSGKAWIDPVALVSIRKAVEEHSKLTAGDKVVRDALTQCYDELVRAWWENKLPEWLTGGSQ